MKNLTFHQYQDAFSDMRKLERREGIKQIRSMDTDQFYGDFALKMVGRNLRAMGLAGKDYERQFSSEMKTLNAEHNWYRYGKPYYKVWPGMVDQLAECDIPIDGKFFHMPYDSFEIRFPVGREGLACEYKEGGESLPVASVLVSREEMSDSKKPDKMPKEDWERRFTLVAHYQFAGARKPEDRGGEWDGWYFGVPIRDGETLDKSMELARNYSHSFDGFNPDFNDVQRIIRLAACVCFFGINNHEVIRPDIPRKHIDKYIKARRNNDDKRVKELLESRRKIMGGEGFHVGSEVDLPTPDVTYHYPDKAPDDPGRELAFSHVRRGHMKLQPCGKNNEDRKLIFVAPTIVRPDLPVNSQHGYRIGREKR